MTKKQGKFRLLGMFAVAIMPPMLLDEGEKVVKSFGELHAFEKEMAYTNYSEFKQKEKEYWQLVFGYLEKHQRLRLRFDNEKAFFEMLKEPDEQKRLEYMPFLKGIKKAIQETFDFEEEEIQYAKKLLKNAAAWRPEYEGQNPLKWVKEGVDELEEILHKPQEQ